MDCCPTCGRKFVATRKASTGVDKKWTEDIARAAQAIEVCRTWQGDKYDHPANVYIISQANELEAQRLERALDNPTLLWSIYRRRDKASGYASVAVATLAA